MQQLSFLNEIGITEGEWSSDDWQTPDEIACLMAKLVNPSDCTILEPCAGSGQIAKFINIDFRFGVALDINHRRVASGRVNVPEWQWEKGDFLTDFFVQKYDLIITNPPFSKCVEFIKRSLTLLNPDNPDARLLFLLPLDWNCPKGRAEVWRSLDAHIHHVYRIKGRVAYLDGLGVPQKGRQCSDAVFDIRPGKLLSSDSYLDEVDPVVGEARGR